MKVREQLPTSQFAKFSSRSKPWTRSVILEMALEQRAVGRRIAELRESRRLTQPVVADRVGVSLRAYQKWEAGTSAPAWRNLEQLSEVLGVTTDELLGVKIDRRRSVDVDLAEFNQRLDTILAEIATIRIELGAVEGRLTDELRQIQPKSGTAAKPNRTRRAK